jgi:hypothetical membrane protein
MSRTEFDRLTTFEKAEIVFQKDSHVDSTVYYNQTISLYLVDGLYVEIWYKPEENEISDITSASAQNLSLYNVHLDLNSLFE